MRTSPTLETSALRSILLVDATVCAAASILMIAGARLIADITDLPPALLRIAGLVIIPYVVFLVALTRREPIPRRGTKAAIGVNLAWAAGCLAILVNGQADPNGPGVAFVLTQAAAVLVFAVIEHQAAENG